MRFSPVQETILVLAMTEPATPQQLAMFALPYYT